MGVGKSRETGLPIGPGHERLVRPNRTEFVFDRAIGNKLTDTAIDQRVRNPAEPMMSARTSRSKSDSPPHLPQPWPDQKAYDSFYRQVGRFGDYTETDYSPWKEIRIPGGASAEEVYRRLPSDLDIEFGGYLTKTRIRFVACNPRHAWMPKSKACTFHSHPTKIQNAEPDVPSPEDLRSFLLNRHWRTITVGRSILWVCEKTPQALDVVRQLYEWESGNLVRMCLKLETEYPDSWEHEFVKLGLRQLGLTVSRDVREWGRVWKQGLEDHLGLRVTVIDRDF